MVRTLRRAADRLLQVVVPRSEAMAACSGCYTVCSSSYCMGVSWWPWPYSCCYKPNCTDHCTRMEGYCC